MLANGLRNPRWSGKPRLASLGVLLAIAAGCSKPQVSRPHAAESAVPDPDGFLAAIDVSRAELRLGDEFEFRVNEVLSPEEQEQMRGIYARLVEDHEIVERPVPAPGGRWSDLEYAVSDACSTGGVEMAVVRTRELDESTIFDLLTVEGRPAQLVVRRSDEPPGWTATATVGRFEDDTPRARLLLKALDEQMKAYGKKRKFGDRQ